jgi:hypothetical protein
VARSCEHGLNNWILKKAENILTVGLSRRTRFHTVSFGWVEVKLNEMNICYILNK